MFGVLRNSKELSGAGGIEEARELRDGRDSHRASQAMVRILTLTETNRETVKGFGAWKRCDLTYSQGIWLLS